MIEYIKKNLRFSINVTMLIIVFLLPIVLAIGFYVNQSFWRFDSKQLGHLIQPPVPVQNLALWQMVADPQGETHSELWQINEEPWQWRLMYYTPTCQNEACLLQLAKIESIHQASGRDFSRISGILLTSPGAAQVNREFLENFNHLQWLQIEPDSVPACIKHGLFIIDPTGQIILHYAVDTPGGEILHDLRHLLKVSQIG